MLPITQSVTPFCPARYRRFETWTGSAKCIDRALTSQAEAKACLDKLELDPHGLKSGSRAAAKWKSENLFYQSGAVSTEAIASALATSQGEFSGLAKVAALGIKVARGCSYHGVALNVAMDLTPFAWIDPCGYAALTTIDLATLGVAAERSAVGARLAERLVAHLGR